jgi:hypothetical protein
MSAHTDVKYYLSTTPTSIVSEPNKLEMFRIELAHSLTTGYTQYGINERCKIGYGFAFGSRLAGRK